MDIHPLLIVSVVIFAGIWCFMALVFGVFIFFFSKDLLRFGHVLTTELPVPPAKDFLDTTPLRLWDSSAFSDLSCRWKGHWRDVTRMGRYEGYTRGVVQSLRDPDGLGWLAFTIDSDHRQERKGVILLKTSARQIELRTSGQRLSSNVHVQAWVDGIEWGSIEVIYPPISPVFRATCLYRSADITSEAQWVPLYRSKRRIFFVKVIVHETDYYPLIVNNRPIASLADMWIRNPRTGVQKPFPAALQPVNDDLNPNEQGILLMMLGMSLYFDTLRFRRLRKDW